MKSYVPISMDESLEYKVSLFKAPEEHMQKMKMHSDFVPELKCHSNSSFSFRVPLAHSVV